MAIPNCKSPVIRGFFVVSLLLAGTDTLHRAAFAGDAVATVTLSCEADYGGHAEKLTLQPTTDVYATQSVALAQRFRFNAQYLSDRAKLKTWVYELRERGPVLLHAAEYPLQADACGAADASSTDFGLNKVYSSDFERELFFRCVRRCE